MITPDSFSDSYIVLEKMIQLGDLMYSELERLLDVLEGQALITLTEHKALLELAKKLNSDQSPGDRL